MHTQANYFIGNNSRVYRSEISLYRHQRETAADCWMVEARAGARELYEIVRPDHGLIITADLADALDQFEKVRGLSLHVLPVVD